MGESTKDSLLAAWRLVKSKNAANVELGRNSLISLGRFEDTLCDMLNHVWEVGSYEDRHEIKKVGDGRKPEGWHWGQGGGGRGLAEYMGTIISYNARFYMSQNSEDKPEFRHLSQEKFAPYIKDVLAAINKANAEIKKAAFDFCKAVNVNDPHEVGAALFLYRKHIDSSYNYNMVPEEYLIRETLQYAGPLSKPPYSKGDHAEYDGDIFEITKVDLQRSGVNMEWHIGTCSLKKDGTINLGNTSRSVHKSDTSRMSLTNINDWAYSKESQRWVKKEAI